MELPRIEKSKTEYYFTNSVPNSFKNYALENTIFCVYNIYS